MFEVDTAILLIVCLVGLVAIGVHIAIALGMTSALGIFLVTGADAYAFQTVQSMLAATAYEAIRAYIFAVIPLFMLMGELTSDLALGDAEVLIVVFAADPDFDVPIFITEVVKQIGHILNVPVVQHVWVLVWYVGFC